MFNMIVPGAEEIVRHIGPLVLFAIGWGLLVTGVAGVAVGWGLLQRRGWARIAAIVLGVLALFHFPFGTARCGCCWPMKAAWNTTAWCAPRKHQPVKPRVVN